MEQTIFGSEENLMEREEFWGRMNRTGLTIGLEGFLEEEKI